VTAATLRTYYVVFFLEIGTRRIIHWNVSTSPDEAWAAQQFRNLSAVNDDLPRYLIHDRDRKYARHADTPLEGAGTKVIPLPVRSPDLNRLCGTPDSQPATGMPGSDHHPQRSPSVLGAG
jgi:putative transposase